ncbi:hypothetical protein [Candidatus Spongiisocius sp.]|uniref:hypothetical protein n=1 Tax=Candidatus Spongiisocius sp. TaxID=3101273 RepID=UPI003B593C9B
MNRALRAAGGPAVALAVLAGLLVPACGGEENPDGYDGAIDCGPPAWSWETEYDRTHEAAPTPYAAMVEFASAYDDRSPYVHVESARTATVVIDGAEVVFVRVLELATETFAAVEAHGCAGFEHPVAG